jgi:hypothetical protein
MLSSVLYRFTQTDRLLDPLPMRLQNYRIGTLDYYEPHLLLSDLHRTIMTDNGPNLPLFPREEFLKGQGMTAREMLGYLATFRAVLVGYSGIDFVSF